MKKLYDSRNVNSIYFDTKILDMFHNSEEGILPMIQVHDELNCSIDSDGEKNKIKEIMENTVELKVPLKVDAEIGPSWGEIKKK